MLETGRGSRKGFSGQPLSSKGWAYSVEEEVYLDETYYAGDEYHDDSQQHDVWAWAAEDGLDDDVIYDDLEEFEQSLEVLVVESMMAEELEIFATESQKLARTASQLCSEETHGAEGQGQSWPQPLSFVPQYDSSIFGWEADFEERAVAGHPESGQSQDSLPCMWPNWALAG